MKHPSEWQADSELSVWKHIKNWFPTKEEHEATKDHIKNLVWWDEVGSLEDSNVYHLNPINFIQQVATLYLNSGVGYGTLSNGVNIETNWKLGYSRNIDLQNKYNSMISLAATKHPNIDLLVFKSLIAQESSFNEKANNQASYAGLTQIGPNEWVNEVGKSLGNTKKIKNKYVFDFDGDERFNALASIRGGMEVLKNKMEYVDKRIEKYSPKLTLREKYKLYMIGYNAGQGTVGRCLLNAYKTGIKNPKWEDMVSGNKKETILWKSMSSKWDKKAKYKEITHYVSGIFNRVDQ